MTTPPARLRLYATPGHACSYLAGREATTVFVDPNRPKDPVLYTLLSRLGFRRSGTHIYRPGCAACSACIPVRIPVDRFRPRRIHRRVRAANRDLSFRIRPARFEATHYSLYRRYVATRHPGGGMDDPSPEQYREFLTSAWCDTSFFEYSLGDAVLAVSVIDRLTDALSCVYTFFEPAYAQRSLGTYAILHAIDVARGNSLEWLYLGYYIADSPKMQYKAGYRPQERFVDGRWRVTG